MSKEGSTIPISVISGSVQPRNYTSKALRIVIDELAKDPLIKIYVIDPLKLSLPLPGQKETKISLNLQKKVALSRGVVLATPEYHGSYSSVIKVIIDNLGYPSVLRGKPVVLLGVASGRIGAVKALEHLRGVCSHIGAMVLPRVVSIAYVDKVFNKAGKCLDSRIEQDIRRMAQQLLEYIK